MSQYKSQIQNLYLSMCRKRHQPVEVVLNTGTTLRGKVRGYDQFSITLAFRDKVEVIYKSAILYISTLPIRRSRPPMPRSGGRPIGRPEGPPLPPRTEGPPAGPAQTTRKPTPVWESDDHDPPPPKKAPRR